MRREMNVNEAAEFVGLGVHDLLEHYRADTIPWHKRAGEGMPYFLREELLRWSAYVACDAVVTDGRWRTHDPSARSSRPRR
jgi:hypothetical protein